MEIESIIKSTLKNGGGSFKLDGSQVESKGYAVSIYAKYSEKLDDLNREKLEGYITRNQALLEQAGNVLGTWLDTSINKTWLDISRIVFDKDEAIKLAKANNQKAIFDLANLVEINTGGTGEFIE